MTAAPETGVTVTLGEIYAQVVSTARKVDGIDTTMTAFRDEVSTQLKDHETRIRADEANRWPLPNIAALAAVTGSAVALAALVIAR